MEVSFTKHLRGKRKGVAMLYQQDKINDRVMECHSSHGSQVASAMHVAVVLSWPHGKGTTSTGGRPAACPRLAGLVPKYYANGVPPTTSDWAQHGSVPVSAERQDLTRRRGEGTLNKKKLPATSDGKTGLTRI